MNLLRAIAVAVAIFMLAPPQPARAQISPNAVWSCEFTNSPTDCGLYLEAAASTRAALVGPGRDGPTAVQLTTQPGDINIAGSGSNDRADLVLARSSTYCNQGQDEWWAHSLMFPPGYVPPPVASVWNWGALFDFHNSAAGGGQPNFMVYATPTGLELHMAGGANTVNRPSDPGYYSIAIGPITKNVWYDFVYHVKWSSGSDGLFQAWLNGRQVMNYSGPNLYVGQSCYLKIANYHTELGLPVSVVHSRVVLAHTQADVQIGSSPPPTVLVPNVVGQTQAAATSAITGAGLTAGTVTQQSSTTVASGNVISESPAAGTSVASGAAVSLVVSSGAPPPTQVAVPNVVGQTQAAATSAITSAGLTAGTVTMQSSTTVASGSVISESPAAGTSVASGSAVNLVVSSGATPPPPPPPVVTKDPVYDFNGSGTSDILWRNSSTGQNVLWLMNGATVASAPALPTVTNLNWIIAGAGDFNGDGKADILWHNQSTGQSQIWFMNGGTLSSAADTSTVSDTHWAIVGVGDFDGDGKADILWRNKSTGQNAIWFMIGGSIKSTANITTVTDQNWTVAGVGDFSGDGKADILWHDTVTGQNQVWLMNGGTVASSAAILTLSDLNWHFAGAGDFDGDGKVDILWRNGSTGQNAVWFMNGATIVSSTSIQSVTDLNWKIVSVGDYNGDGKADILWRNGSTGQDSIFFMNGGTVASTLYPPSQPVAGWTVALH